jgi:hypothetical protein
MIDLTKEESERFKLWLTERLITLNLYLDGAKMRNEGVFQAGLEKDKEAISSVVYWLEQFEELKRQGKSHDRLQD